MFRILMSPTHGWLIQDSKTNVETGWKSCLLKAYSAELTDPISDNDYYTDRNTITLLCTDVRPTWSYIQLHHPELLV